MSNLIEIKNLTISFEIEGGKIIAVDNSSFEIKRGQVVGLVGESGCGKSVTAMSILRLLPMPPGKYESGEIIFDEKNIRTLSIPELNKVRGARIGMIFQEPMTALSPLMKIGNQISETLQTHHKMTKAETWACGVEWLKKVGISDAEQKMNSFPFELSGGMRQRVMIAMAQMLEPDLIIADEPTTALDVTIQAQVFELMKEVRGNESSMLLITHDMGVIWENCDRVIVMYASQIIEMGSLHEIFTDAKHPYTQGLLKAVPKLDEQMGRMETIEGNVPAPSNYPKGCHFSTRCPHATDKCHNKKPPMTIINDSHKVKCFLATEEGV
ncbi:MAG: peptide ABC transporter ATP-binding protein [Planctomycetota bacterium]|nr:MAG: peptide ABC transporter ATP-binding protein [Planctomycetota bacterium]